MNLLNESTVETAALEYLRELGYSTEFGPEIAPDTQFAERSSWSQVYLYERLREAMIRLNKGIDPASVDEAVKRLERAESQNAVTENKRVHELMRDGVPLERRTTDGQLRTDRIHLIDFDHTSNNEWLAVNQFTIIEGKNRRPDVLVFLNGIPVALFELKNLADEHATLRNAWNQVQTYRSDIPSIFTPNVVTVISDGTSAAMSSFTGAFEHYAPWKTMDGREVVTNRPALEVLVKGVFDQKRFLDILQNFVVFSDEGKGLVKRVAKYHQYWAVNAAVESTVEAAGPNGDRRGGVVWHTQGSGKSFEMVFFAAKLMRDPRMNNPTLVFITDRNDLDDQLFGEVFAPAEILPEKPVRADSRIELRQLLRRASGGILFTTLQKFAPEVGGDTNPVLTDRRNVVVVADEAHRSQYGFTETLGADGTLKSGLAKHLRDALPNATYLGFTGTPIESADKSTRSVFGDYIDVYDLTRAVEDGATVKIYYESRLAKVSLNDDAHADIDALADEITEEVEESDAIRAKSRWSRVEAIVGASERLDLIAADIVDHWEKRRAELFGKAMIVAMSRRIAVELYDRIVKLRPDWHSDDPKAGKIKVVMTGSAADPTPFQRHLYDKKTRTELKSRAKDPDDPLEIVIVRDMWLTGFDSPALHTMYVDKPMQGAGLMQAIARVNRTFRDKPGGLIVDYIGVATNLRKALAEYSPSDQDQAGVPIEEMVAVMLEKHDVVRAILYGCPFDSSPLLSASERLGQHASVLDFVMADPDRTSRFLDQVLALTRAFALCGARDEAVAIRNDIRLFADVRAAIIKIQNPDSGRAGSGGVEIDTAISQLVNEAVSADEVIDIYKLAGVDTPDLSILSDEFLDSLAGKEKPNLQMGLLRRLINDQIRTIQRSNLVQARKFSEQLDEAINRYTNRALSTAEIIAELVKLAKEMRDQNTRHEQLGLSVAEAAFYDAIVQNDSAVLTMGDEVLKKIAVDLVTQVQSSITIDWNFKASVKAEMRAKVRRLLAKYDYPPDLEEKAVELVLQQAELFASSEATS
ncbi:type I restriction endonuclease subunit R [Acidithrix ferrooxidans]|uniref:Type I restriction enzyme endonuclease subunit n=1 Tax=Acidithrix ferrooxidans TaxID=1280514 RepID=A0A0D8HFQ2_9ACTN|nr:type I restriction endonuclease subunit R [Acidithrix ferrooxidans]KJF16622.1 type-1 restriction enzyme R protein [Acidithrix ferrooxidans]